MTDQSTTVLGEDGDIEKLRALSQAAPAGPWEGSDDFIVPCGQDRPVAAVVGGPGMAGTAALIAGSVNYVRAMLAAAPSAPQGGGVVCGWLDRHGDVWRNREDIPHSRVADARPLFTAQPRTDAAQPPAEAQVWCPSCDGAGWTPDAMDGSARAICPDCAGSGRGEHSITVNEAQAQGGGEVEYARCLAVDLWQRHYREVAPEWEPFPDLAGLLSQIDNMASGLCRFDNTAPPSAPAPVAGDAVAKLVKAARKVEKAIQTGGHFEVAEARTEMLHRCETVEAALAQDRASQAAAPSAPVGVEDFSQHVIRIAGYTGVHYSAKEKCELGAQFYAFTPTELHLFAERIVALAQQPAACDMGELCIGCEPRNADGSCPDQQPAAVDGAISHADLCALSRVFNENNNLRLSRDQRINDWLGKHIAAALAAQPGGSDNE